MSQQSFHQQTANGSNIAFTITTFSEDEIKVYVDGVESTNGGSSQNDYTIPNYTTSGGTVTWNTTGSLTAPASPSVVRVVRQTDVMNNGNTAVEGKATFQAGSSVRADDLNNNTKQTLRALKETQDQLVQSYDFEPQAVNTAAIKDLNVTRAKIAADAIDGTKLADDSIDSEHIVADSLDTEHYAAGSVDTTALGADSVTNAKIADDQIDSEHYVDGSIDTQHIADAQITHLKLANDCVDGDNIQDDVINSEHYVALSIDTEHIANENVTTAKLASDAVTSAKLADNAVDSEHYVDGSVDHVHLANDAVDGDNIADNSINSEHYVDGSIDHVHLATDIIDGDNIQDSVINSEHYVDGSIDREHLAADIVDGTKIADDAIGAEHIQANAVTDSEIATGTLDNRYFTETELTNGALDGRYYTETESDARYFNISTGDTIKDGDTFPDNDTTIATTAAINDRIIDLVDDVGGFVPIANETSFPTANPDVNNGAGTIVSVKAASTGLTAQSGTTLTISNGAGTGNTVTITGLSVTIPSGFGFLVETTTTLHTYAFHRLVPKATEVTTVAGISSDITTVANNTSNINAVAADASDIGTVAADGTDIGLVAGSISNVNTTAGSISNVNTVAGSISNVNSVASNISNVNAVNSNESNINSAVSNASNINSAVSNASNINTVAGSISNVNTTAGSIANVNTVASNISNVNSFAGTYQIASSAPSTDGAGNALAAGDLYFDTSANELRVHNGSTFQGGVTATGNLAGLGANTFTGNQTIENDSPSLSLVDSSNNPDYRIRNQDGTFKITDTTNNAGRITVNSDGHVDIHGNLDAEGGLDVTGNITVSGNVDGRDVAADGVKLDGIEASATADQTAAEIRTLVESASDSNVFTDDDHTKLNGIEASATADQTAAEIKTLLDSNGIVNSNVDASAAIAGTKISPDFGSQAVTTTGNLGGKNLNLLHTAPTISLTDSNADDDFQIKVDGGLFKIIDATNTADRFQINSSGTVDIGGNLDVGAGIDVTGDITVSGTVDGVDLQTLNTAVSANTAKVTNATHTGDVTGSTSLTIANDAVDGTKIADDSINSEHYVDGSIDHAHLSNDCVDGDNIADDSINSEHYVNGSIDTAHIADDAVDADKLANSINSAIAANTAKTSNATHTGDVTGSTSLTIANNAVTTAKIADEAVTLAKLEHGTSSNDGKFLRANNGADPTFETVNTDLVSDTSPQLGGLLDGNGQTANFTANNTGLGIPIGTTANQPTASSYKGYIRYNDTDDNLYYSDGSDWNKFTATTPVLSSVSGNIFVSSATNLTLSGSGFLSSGLVVNFTQSSDSIDSDVTVTPTSDSAATVAVPAAVYNNVTANNAVTIKVTNSDAKASGTVNKTAVALPSGGSITTSGSFRIHTFTSSGTFVNTIASNSVEYLVVGGGASGGNTENYGVSGSSGGGAGGYRSSVSGESSGGGASAESALSLSTGNYTVTIGGGGGGH